MRTQVRLGENDFVVMCKYNNTETSKRYETYPLEKLDPEGTLPKINCKHNKTPNPREQFLEKVYEDLKANGCVEVDKEGFSPVKGAKRKKNSPEAKEAKRNRKF